MSLMPLNFREEHSIFFLVKSLKAIQSSKDPVTLWQSSNAGRHVITNFIFDINLKTKKIIFKTNGKSYPFKLDSKVFFHCFRNDILFKADIDVCDDQFLVLKFPLKIKAKENRAEKRINLLDRIRPIDFCFLKLKAYESIPLEYSFKASDVSNSGGSFIISSGALTNFLVDDVLLITSIGKNDISPPVKASTRYITKLAEDSASGFSSYKIGFKFEQKIDSAKYL
jgi:hypothetical protein